MKCNTHHLSVLTILTFVLIVGIFLRFYRLDLNQPPLYADEIGHYEHYYQVINPNGSLLSNLYQVIFRGGFSFTWIFGLNPLGVRAASAVYGSLSLVFIYLFTKYLQINQKYSSLATITTIIACFSPWNFNLSRLGHTHIPILIILVCFHFYLYSKANKPTQYLFSLAPLLISLLYYPSTVVLVSFGLIPVFIEIWKITKKQPNPIHLSIIFSLFLISIGTFIFRYNGFSILSRGLDLAIWRDVNVTAESNLYRGLARFSSPSIFSFNQNPETIGNKLIYNYPISVINEFFSNYLSFFSPSFLFESGDPILRHSTGQTGVFLAILLPFIIFGSYSFFIIAPSKSKNLFLLWILISPLPAALTKDGYGYLLRGVTLMPILTYFSALGLITFIKHIKVKFIKYITATSILIIFIFSTYYYMYGYFHVYQYLSADSFEAGFKELSDFQVSHQNQKMLVIWDGYYPHLHFRFWQQTPIEEYHSFNNIEWYINQSLLHKVFENLYFSLPQDEKDLELILANEKIKYFSIPEKYLKNYPNITSKTQPEKIIFSNPNKPEFLIYRYFND